MGEPVQVPRDPGAWWQVCTNFFLSGELPIQPQPDYLRSAYARYGRMLHLFAVTAVEHMIVAGRARCVPFLCARLCVERD